MTMSKVQLIKDKGLIVMRSSHYQGASLAAGPGRCCCERESLLYGILAYGLVQGRHIHRSEQESKQE